MPVSEAIIEGLLDKNNNKMRRSVNNVHFVHPQQVISWPPMNTIRCKTFTFLLDCSSAFKDMIYGRYITESQR